MDAFLMDEALSFADTGHPFVDKTSDRWGASPFLRPEEYARRLAKAAIVHARL